MIELRKEEPKLDVTGTIFKEERAKALRQIGEQMQQGIQQAIAASGINDAHGKVSGWQELRYGTKGGYVAISPVTGKTGKNSPGAITNYLESGHMTQLGLGKSKRYDPKEPRGTNERTTAFRFYQKTNLQIERYTDAVISELEEKTGAAVVK